MHRTVLGSFVLLSSLASIACGGSDSGRSRRQTDGGADAAEASTDAAEISTDGEAPGKPHDAAQVEPDAGTDGPAPDDARSPNADGDADAGDGCAGEVCGSLCCADDEACFGGVACVPTQGTCDTNDDCQHDTFCLDGECVPYGVGGNPATNEECRLDTTLTEIKPVVQCRWDTPPEDDPHPTHFQVMSTPVVGDLNLDDDPDVFAPSIVFATFAGGAYTSAGYLRVISGTDCTHQMTAPDDPVVAVAPVVIADLDADEQPEIVAANYGGGVIAFRLSADRTGLERLWRSATCDSGTRTPDLTGSGAPWSGPSIADLDDDGSPEIIWGATVYDSNGCVLSSSLGFPAYSQGYVPVVLDVDGDGKVELVLGNGLYEWDVSASDWVAEPAFSTAGLATGQTAVAELGDFPVANRGGEDFPEIVVVSSGQVRVQTIDGTVVFGPVAIPGGGVGGPPTVADFDGDGRPEFASAGGSNYVVFDLDCVDTGADGGANAGCVTGRTDGVLWVQPSQDFSSNVTGSSVFDFDANGRAEVAYADECFFRIYDGATGEVAASIGNMSGTTYENPVVADTDGDFRSEIVICANDYYAAGLNCPAVDPLFQSTPSATLHGITVLRDEEDGWAASRPIWNQHAYSVTNVTDTGTIPKTSEVALNWETAGLNNFRQNTQGGLSALGLSDLTVSDGESVCDGDTPALRARLCNRGLLPAPAGIGVAIETGDGELCRPQTSKPLPPGECVVLECPLTASVDEAMVSLLADPDGTVRECFDANNVGRTAVVSCE